MKVACISCPKTWDDGKEDKHPDGRLSHGLCKDCARILLIPTIRKKQLREDKWPCFGTAEWYCDRADCKYRLVCLK